MKLKKDETGKRSDEPDRHKKAAKREFAAVCRLPMLNEMLTCRASFKKLIQMYTTISTRKTEKGRNGKMERRNRKMVKIVNIRGQ